MGLFYPIFLCFFAVAQISSVCVASARLLRNKSAPFAYRFYSFSILAADFFNSILVTVPSLISSIANSSLPVGALHDPTICTIQGYSLSATSIISLLSLILVTSETTSGTFSSRGSGGSASRRNESGSTAARYDQAHSVEITRCVCWFGVLWGSALTYFTPLLIRGLGHGDAFLPHSGPLVCLIRWKIFAAYASVYGVIMLCPSVAFLLYRALKEMRILSGRSRPTVWRERHHRWFQVLITIVSTVVWMPYAVTAFLYGVHAYAQFAVFWLGMTATIGRAVIIAVIKV